MSTKNLLSLLLIAALPSLAQPAPKPAEHVHAESAAPYSCPMHPEVTSKTAGKCSKCGMTLELPKGDAPGGLPALDVPVGGAHLSLADLERMALGASPLIGQAKALVDAAAGRAQQAGLWPNPSFGANGEHVSRVTGEIGRAHV